MSQLCPLCGKTKPEEALFCDDCARKIHTEYEVNISDEVGKGRASPAEGMPAAEGSGETKSNRAASSVETRAEQTGPAVLQPRNSGNRTESQTEQTGPGDNMPKRKKRFGTPLLFVLLIALLAGAFFIYNTTTRKSNLDRSGWDAAVKANSVEGYLAYMEAHPRGAHFDEAEAGLLGLKSEEAAAWQRMKETDNVTELRDFLEQHAGSPYTSLVKTRLDSLIWVGSLQTNTADSYSDYIMLMENGEIRGDYIAEAKKRYDWLFNSQPVDSAVLDSIRTTIDGFFLSLSSLNHSGMFRYLAPMVNRFFDSGAATRERITGELLVTGAQTGGTTLKFIPDLESVQCEVANNNHYKVNVPLQKNYPKDGVTVQVHGYIVHMELDPFFQITGIFETKPYPEAP